jgi:AcrR family transcriptional regulator
MSVNNASTDARSVTSSARRRQIVDAAIEVIAESGYAKASFARIAEKAGLSSTRFISYHFKGKSELLAAVVVDVISGIGDYVGQRVQAELTAAGMLRTYIEAVVEYIDGHRAPMIALTEVMLGAGFGDGIAGDQAATSDLETILRAGQASGEFRDFDPWVMATAVQRSVDALPFALRTNPGIDLGSYAAEMVTLFALGTARTAR